MKTAGIIAEYNPFHNGHAYHIRQTKQLTGADYVIVVMSGNFVQRGAPAFLDKYTRAKAALLDGADLVLELPSCYCTASAEYFALGAVSMLEKTGITNCLSFGSETGSIRPLQKIASVFNQESSLFSSEIKKLLKAGFSYPAARMKAALNCCTDSTLTESVFSSPNNILGIEYLKALETLSSPIIPFTIKRMESEYHSTDLTGQLSSASAIRAHIMEGKPLAALKKLLPSSSYPLMENGFHRSFPITEDDFSLALNLRLFDETAESLNSYLDLSPDLSKRILHTFDGYHTFSQLAMLVKSKNHTLSRINRAFIHILLNITKEEIDLYKQNGYIQYLKILGLKKSSAELMHSMKKNASVPIISKAADAKKQLTLPGFTMFRNDIRAARIYNQIVYNKFGKKLPDDYRQPFLIL